MRVALGLMERSQETAREAETLQYDIQETCNHKNITVSQYDYAEYSRRTVTCDDCGFRDFFDSDREDQSGGYKLEGWGEESIQWHEDNKF